MILKKKHKMCRMNHTESEFTMKLSLVIVLATEVWAIQWPLPLLYMLVLLFAFPSFIHLTTPLINHTKKSDLHISSQISRQIHSDSNSTITRNMACTSQLPGSLSLPTILPRSRSSCLEHNEDPIELTMRTAKPLRCIDPATTTSAEELAAMETRTKLNAAVHTQAVIARKPMARMRGAPRVLCRMNMGTRVYVHLPQQSWEVPLENAIRNIGCDPSLVSDDFLLLPLWLKLKQAFPSKGLALKPRVHSNRHWRAIAALINIFKRALEFCILHRVGFRNMLPILVKAFRASRAASDREFFERVVDAFEMTRDDKKYDLGVLAIKATHDQDLVAGRVYGNFCANTKEERKYWTDAFLDDLGTCLQDSWNWKSGRQCEE